MVIQAFGRIKELRQSRGMTQTELAKTMPVARSSVNAWAMGISVPTAAKLVELSLFFHVSTDYILGLETRGFIALDGLDGEQRGILYALSQYFYRQGPEAPGKNPEKNLDIFLPAVYHKNRLFTTA